MTAQDRRVRVPVDKPIRLEQLASEIGVALTASDVEVVVADEAAEVTAAALAAAIEAHTPDPEFGLPDEDVQLARLRAKAQAVKAGSDTFTAAQVQKILAHLVLRATR